MPPSNFGGERWRRAHLFGEVPSYPLPHAAQLAFESPNELPEERSQLPIFLPFVSLLPFIPIRSQDITNR